MPTGWNALFPSLQGEVRTSAITQPKGVGEAKKKKKKKKKSPEGSSLPTEFLFFFLRFIYLFIIFGCVGAFL